MAGAVNGGAIIAAISTKEIVPTYAGTSTEMESFTSRTFLGQPKQL